MLAEQIFEQFAEYHAGRDDKGAHTDAPAERITPSRLNSDVNADGEKPVQEKHVDAGDTEAGGNPSSLAAEQL
jgi:hypothetical protein